MSLFKRSQIRNKSFEWGQKTYIMGVLNVTPDSFSDGGQFNTLASALEQAQRMVDSGVDILDIGGQSTRPGAEIVPLEEELNRVVPLIEKIRNSPNHLLAEIPISVDTTRAKVAEAAVKGGADFINDISGATFEPEILSVAAKWEVPIILMHIRGTPKTMQTMTNYQDLMKELKEFLEERIQTAIATGIKAENIIIDPGIGFAKNYEQNLEILRQLKELRSLNCPILVGVSRKSFIGHILNQPDPKQRVWGTAAACVAAIANSADILRVHDVKEIKEVSQVADAIYRFS